MTVREPTGNTVIFPNYKLSERAGFLEKGYYRFTANCIYYLRSWGWRQAANTIGSLMAETMHSLYAGYCLLWGFGKAFHYYGLNPIALTEEQKNQTAFLLLHGKGSNQGVWLSLAKFFEKKIKGPIFTLNTSDGELTNDDLSRIEEKYLEIHKLYEGRPVKITLIGHSRGAEYALYAALPPQAYSLENGYCRAIQPWVKFRDEIHHIIRIGSPMLQAERDQISLSMLNRIYEINGKRDLLIPDHSLADASHQFIVDCGHLSLLFDCHAQQTLLNLCSSS